MVNMAEYARGKNPLEREKSIRPCFQVKPYKIYNLLVKVCWIHKLICREHLCLPDK
jgi:hypothetical protein